MFKNISMLLAGLVFTFFVIEIFAISPGAGQAQVRNSMQEMQQNKKRMQQHKQNQEMIQQQKNQSQRGQGQVQ